MQGYFDLPLFPPAKPAMKAAAVMQSVRAFAMHAEGWVYEFQPWHSLVVKTVSDSSHAKR